MNDGDGGLIGFISEIIIKSAKLADEKHAFVDNGAGGKGADIGIFGALLKFTPDDV